MMIIRQWFTFLGRPVVLLAVDRKKIDEQKYNGTSHFHAFSTSRSSIH